MIKTICHQLYASPLWQVIIFMIVVVCVWGIIGSLVLEKYNKNIFWKIVNIVVMLGMLSSIVAVTLSNRERGEYGIVLALFHSFIEAKTQPEMYRSMLMNVFLFFPLGLCLPHILPEKWKGQIIISTIFAMVLSAGIEYAQYHYHLGRAEADDVICNTFGCVIGCISYAMTYKRENTI